MAKYLCFDSVGNCVQEGSCADGDEFLQRPDLTTVVCGGSFLDAYYKDGVVKTKTAPPADNYVFDVLTESWLADLEAMTAQAKNTRNDLLAQCDWTQSKDIPETISLKWQPYRQHLRDITKQSSFPITINWGTPPKEVKQ